MLGHLGEANELTLMATLAGCEMGLKMAGVPVAGSGVTKAMEVIGAQQAKPQLKKAS